MATEIHSAKMSQVVAPTKSDLNVEKVQTPQTDDFLENIVAADPESFNVCISCD